jgi:hypothetical protein
MGQYIDPHTTWVIDPKEFSELDLECFVTIPSSADGQLPFQRVSVVQIRYYLPHIVGSGCEELLTDIRERKNELYRSSATPTKPSRQCG